MTEFRVPFPAIRCLLRAARFRRAACSSVLYNPITRTKLYFGFIRDKIVTGEYAPRAGVGKQSHLGKGGKRSMSAALLQIRNLSVSVEGNEILHDISLDVHKGETHVLMGPNVACFR